MMDIASKHESSDTTKCCLITCLPSGLQPVSSSSDSFEKQFAACEPEHADQDRDFRLDSVTFHTGTHTHAGQQTNTVMYSDRKGKLQGGKLTYASCNLHTSTENFLRQAMVQLPVVTTTIVLPYSISLHTIYHYPLEG